MSYTIYIAPAAEKSFKRLSKSVQQRLANAIRKLVEKPCPDGCEKLKGTKREWWRLRVGDYRIIYEIREKELILLVVKIGDRKDVYRALF